MSDKSPPGIGPAFALPGHGVLALQGRDAVAFAQAQFMNDVNALAAGQWHWSGWLTPKGRVIALFALLRLDDETLWLVLPDDPQALAERLRSFVFRSKLTIAPRSDLRIEGCFVVPATAAGNTAATDADGSVELDMSGDGGARSLRIRLAAGIEAAGIETPADPAHGAAARWQVADLEHGLPRLKHTQAEQWTPQQLSLERLHAFSIKKGCYPGQEIIARTHFLGKAKRRLALLEGTAPVDDGSDVMAGGTTLGRVAATASADGRHLALAVLPFEREASALGIGGNPVLEGALLDGLAR